MAYHPLLDIPPWRLTGTVVAALVNHRRVWSELGSAAHLSPYKAPPSAPVLAVMPRHTQVLSGQSIAIPAEGVAVDSRLPGGGSVEVGVALGLVIGQTACRVPLEAALSVVAGYLVVGELSLPAPAGVAAHYRPGARLRARDGFCPLGDRVVPAGAVSDPDGLRATVEIDGREVLAADTGDRVRGAAQLLADVSAFMTLHPGDVLTIGRFHPPALARAGQRIRLAIEGVGVVEHPLVAESVPGALAGSGLHAGVRS
jgi:5-oxopent-3-ene-1,2,5-tricarboxylate decarboxylase/2-hydroxyhepta-2,4-diene-1,7-dioate isomerase